MILVYIVFIALLFVVASGAGFTLVSRIRSAQALTPAEALGVSFAIGIMALYFAVMLVGRYRLDFASMSAVLAAAAALAVPGWRHYPWRRLQADISGLLRLCRQDLIAAILLVAVIGVLLSALLQGLAPPNDYDSLMYHLAFPHLDVERGVILPLWDRGMPHGFFPQLTGNLYRLILAVAGEAPVQMLTGIMGTVVTVSTAAICRRVGGNLRLQLGAALAYCACRVVVWQMATPEVEIALTMFTVLAILCSLAWFKEQTLGLAVLTGLMLGGGLAVKFHGLVIAVGLAIPLLIFALRQPMRLIPQLLIAALAGIAIFIPHSALNYYYSGNPLYPIFNNVFMHEGRDYFHGVNLLYGIGRSVTDIIPTLWFLSVHPMEFFDGMVLGAPYLLALAPLAVLSRKNADRSGVLTVVFITYYIVWFYFLSQQVRFLSPILPIVAIWAAIGASVLWQHASNKAVFRFIAGVLLTLLIINQSLFVGIYAALRLPPALGLMSAEVYHTRTPTLGGAYYGLCQWVRENTGKTEWLLSMVVPHSSYCPQDKSIIRVFPQEEKSWIKTGTPPNLSKSEFVCYYLNQDIRWVIVPKSYENRRNISGESKFIELNLEDNRFGLHLKQVIASLSPVYSETLVSVYDGRQIRDGLVRDNPARDCKAVH